MDNRKTVSIRELCDSRNLKDKSYLRVLNRVFNRKTGVIYNLSTWQIQDPGLLKKGELYLRKQKKPSAGDGLEFQTVAKW